MADFPKINRETTTFHLHLLSKVIDLAKYPVIRLVIENNISREEYEELFQLLEELDEKYASQKKEGLLDYSSLLVHFVGMLNEKLEPHETIRALKKEGYYPSLLSEFVYIMQRENLERRRW
ncbi:DUF1878 family protein [Virgibacillus xinjiangensis]|uniref:DUF1878 family protein n=1 Tax=Virgibacillus xinjiangensis TaxID=393090 RepID=A0ABV7CW34_9BACI